MKHVFFAFAFAFFIFSCKTPKQETAVLPAQEKSENTSDSSIEQIINKMSLRQKIGQVFIVNFRYCALSEAESGFGSITDFENSDGTVIKVVPLDRVNQTAREAIQKYHIGNIILFAENTADTKKLLEMIYQFQREAVSSNGIPMIIGIDQEGGRVNRIFQTAVFPSAQKIGRTKDTQFAFYTGKYIAEQLNAFGINLNFAPVCDVFSNPKNSVIGDRSFSSDPVQAGTFAAAFKDGTESENVISCAKHFPGHGDTATDSHIGLPVIRKTKEQWLSCEAVPFKINISRNIPMIMSAHIQYPMLDNSRITADKTGKSIVRPATLSKKILTDILRGELHFDGVIVTDALDMNAISKNFSESQAVIEALNAGADLLCNPISITGKADIARLEKLYAEIERAVKTGTLSEDRLNKSVRRILKLKKEYGILDAEFQPVTNQTVQQVETQLKNQKYKNLLRLLQFL